MTLPLRVEDMTDEQIRAMEPGDELDWHALQFLMEVNNADDDEYKHAALCWEGDRPPNLNCPKFRKSDGRIHIDQDLRVSRDDGAAMRLWKALGEWWRNLQVGNCAISESSLSGYTVKLVDNWTSTVMGVTSIDLTHAIAILGALAAKWRKENGK